MTILFHEEYERVLLARRSRGERHNMRQRQHGLTSRLLSTCPYLHDVGRRWPEWRSCYRLSITMTMAFTGLSLPSAYLMWPAGDRAMMLTTRQASRRQRCHVVISRQHLSREPIGRRSAGARRSSGAFAAGRRGSRTIVRGRTAFWITPQYSAAVGLASWASPAA